MRRHIKMFNPGLDQSIRHINVLFFASIQSGCSIVATLRSTKILSINSCINLGLCLNTLQGTTA